MDGSFSALIRTATLLRDPAEALIHCLLSKPDGWELLGTGFENSDPVSRSRRSTDPLSVFKVGWLGVAWH